MAKKRRTKKAGAAPTSPGNPMLEQVGPDFYDEAALADQLLVDGRPAEIDDVRRLRAQGHLIALATADGQWIHPTWQVRGGELLPGLPDVLTAFAGHPAWSVALWLTTGHDDLEGSTPAEALAAGRDPADVVALAERTAHGWAN